MAKKANVAGPVANSANVPNITQKKGKNVNQNANQNTTRKQWNPI